MFSASRKQVKGIAFAGCWNSFYSITTWLNSGIRSLSRQPLSSYLRMTYQKKIIRFLFAWQYWQPKRTKKHLCLKISVFKLIIIRNYQIHFSHLGCNRQLSAWGALSERKITNFVTPIGFLAVQILQKVLKQDSYRRSIS